MTSIGVVTIGREYGSGGRLIAQRIAERLSWEFYDKAIIELAAQETGLSEGFIRSADEQKTTSFLYNLYFGTQNLSLSEQIFIAESNVIRRAARKERCVIVGRCADYVLRDFPGQLHVFIHAPLEERARRIREDYGAAGGELDACAAVKRQDKSRAAYYQHFTDRKWGDIRNYHLSVSSTLGMDEVAGIVTDLVEKSRE